MDYPVLESEASALGLVLRGALDLAPDERTGVLEGRQSLVLIGMTGRLGWDAFARAPEAKDGAPDPLDRWSLRAIGELAARTGAVALFPFTGPPFHPFQQWALRAEGLFPSPLGLLIHPRFGLWHSYRGALAFGGPVTGAPHAHRGESPCAACVERPCLSACPVKAFTEEAYAVETCIDHLAGPSGGACLNDGCAARLACPVGRAHVHGEDQMRFGMAAFIAAHPPRA